MARNAQTNVDDQLKRAAALRDEVDRVDRDRLPASGKAWWLTRRLRVVSAIVTIAVIGVLLTDAWLAFDVFGDGRAPGVSHPQDVPSYENLVIFNDSGRFAGRVKIVNPLDHDVEVFVDVDIYDGEQNVGRLYDSISLKPDSESELELTGYDDYLAYTDSRVHLSGWTE